MGVFSFQIIGAGRGGTSLLAALVDAHRDVDVRFESFSIPYLMGQDDSGETTSLADRTARRLERYFAACEPAAAQSAKPLFGHKATSEQIWGLAAPPLPGSDAFDPIAAYIDASKRVLTIYIVRDGRSCVPSKMRRVGITLDSAIARWRFSVDLLRRLDAAGAALHVVRMEDLVADRVGERWKPLCQRPSELQ